MLCPYCSRFNCCNHFVRIIFRRIHRSWRKPSCKIADRAQESDVKLRLDINVEERSSAKQRQPEGGRAQLEFEACKWRSGSGRLDAGPQDTGLRVRRPGAQTEARAHSAGRRRRAGGRRRREAQLRQLPRDLRAALLHSARRPTLGARHFATHTRLERQRHSHRFARRAANCIEAIRNDRVVRSVVGFRGLTLPLAGCAYRQLLLFCSLYNRVQC